MDDETSRKQAWEAKLAEREQTLRMGLAFVVVVVLVVGLLGWALL
jgi:hypothetical protein